MKNTYDDKEVKFEVKLIFAEHDKLYEMNQIYGVVVPDYCEKIKLSGERSYKEKTADSKSSTKQNSEFFISVTEELTVEDEIKKYLLGVLENLKKVRKAHALCFLERYCMDYEEIKLKLTKEKN